MTSAIRVSMPLLVLLSAAPALAQNTPPRQPVGTTGTSAPASPSPAAKADVDADYKLAAGDKLRVEVYKDPQLSQSLQIRPDGKITLPLVGDLAAAGRTPIQLRDTITESLKPYITTPTVTVIVVETVPKTIYVMGEVTQPGPQPLTGQLTVMQALATAGGFKDFANTKNIIIRRHTASGTQDLLFNYKDALKNREKPVYLQPGDTIIVP